ncbi:hypothetical protein [Escherichia coli]
MAQNRFPVIVDINTDNFTARHHDVIDGHLFQIEHRQQHILIATGNL